MLSASFGHVSSSADGPSAAANTGQLSAGREVHWMLVCWMLFFFTSTHVPQLRHSCGRSPPDIHVSLNAGQSPRAGKW